MTELELAGKLVRNGDHRFVLMQTDLVVGIGYQILSNDLPVMRWPI